MEPECLGQPWPEEAAAAARGGGSRRVLGFAGEQGRWRGELEKRVQPKKRARKEEAWKVHCWCGRGGEGWERSLSLQTASCSVGERAEVSRWRDWKEQEDTAG